MPHETEVKLAVHNSKALLRHLKRLGAKLLLPPPGRVHEMNLLFDTADGGLAKHGQLLRMRTETHEPSEKSRSAKPTQRFLLSFKSPPDELLTGGAPAEILPAHGRYKVREEVELTVSDPGALRKIFEGLGLRGWFRYEKYRTTYQLPGRHKWAKGLLIEIDEVPIGTFVELEGPSDAIDSAAKELGFSAKDYITKNYLVLYLDTCRQRGQQPSDMLFPAVSMRSSKPKKKK
jgi:adenylate cyclase, class 2